MMDSNNILVEVAYATADRQQINKLLVKKGTTAKEAVIKSDIIKIFPEIDLDNLELGIFSKKTSLDTELKEKDRVEIYRPLLADPKESRKKRASKAKETKENK